MPPKRATKKRKVDEVVESDDNDEDMSDAASPPRTASASKKKKLTKQEKAEARERARVAMMGPNSSSAKKKTPAKSPATAGTPAKRRKLSDDAAAASPTRSASAKKPSFVQASTPSATTKPAAATTSKKQTKKQARQEAHERARVAMMGPSTTSSTPAASSSSPQKKRPARASTAATRTTTSKTAELPTPPPSNFAATDNNNHTLPTPPAASTFVTTPVLAQPTGSTTLFGGLSPRLFQGGPTIPKVETGVSVRATFKETTQAEEETHDEHVGWWETAKHLAQQPWGQGIIIFVAVLSIVLHLLYFTGHLVYSPKSGMLLLLGPTRMRYQDNVPYYQLAEQPHPDPIVMTVPDDTVCYLDSPNVLELFDHPDDLTATLDGKETRHRCPNQQPPLPCPPGHLCFRGHVVGCATPAFELWDAAAEDFQCILRPVVNATYQTLVELLEGYSVQHLCLNHVDGPTPKSFYTSSSSAAAVTTADDESDETLPVEVTETSTSTSGIPLYAWSTLFRKLDIPEELEDDWNWETVQQANAALKQLIFQDTTGNDPMVGLAPSPYWHVEATQVPLSCKVSRRLLGTLDGIGRLLLAVVMFVLSTAWYFLRVHPYITIGVAALVGGLQYRRHRQARHQAQLKRVNEIRLLALEELQSALSAAAAPGDGMKPGEVAVMHLRDSLSFQLHGSDSDEKRHEFCYELWPLVVAKIRMDNRVKKSHRYVGSTKRDLWMWVATKTKTSASSSSISSGGHVSD